MLRIFVGLILLTYFSFSLGTPSGSTPNFVIDPQTQTISLSWSYLGESVQSSKSYFHRLSCTNPQISLNLSAPFSGSTDMFDTNKARNIKDTRAIGSFIEISDQYLKLIGLGGQKYYCDGKILKIDYKSENYVDRSNPDFELLTKVKGQYETARFSLNTKNFVMKLPQAECFYNISTLPKSKSGKIISLEFIVFAHSNCLDVSYLDNQTGKAVKFQKNTSRSGQGSAFLWMDVVPVSSNFEFYISPSNSKPGGGYLQKINIDFQNDIMWVEMIVDK